jgi:trk system potassium uptake protein TrkA
VPSGETPLEGHDELLFVAIPEREKELQELLCPHAE